MPYNAEPGEVAYVVASAQLNHGQIAADQGFCGVAVKQQTPHADTVRASRAIIASGEAYLLLISKVAEAPATGDLATANKGDLVYIDPTDNSLTTTSGSGLLTLGKVCSLPSERGTPANKVRINLRQKV